VPERRIPVACVQTRAHDRSNFEAAWQRVLSLTDKAAAAAELVVLPEGTVPAYVLGTEPVDPELLANANGDLARIARVRGATIVYGGVKLVEQPGASPAALNAAIVIGPDGRELGFAAKQFLWHFDRRWFAAGNTLDPIDTPAGRLGLLVCADGRIPTIAATLVERGAEMLVMPTAWVTSGRNPDALENVQADLMINVRARENRVPFAGANKCGVELESVAYCGKSAIVDASGSFLARAGQSDDEIVAANVTIEPTREREPAPASDLATRNGNASSAAIGTLRARIAITLAGDAAEIRRLATAATTADADLLIASGADASSPIPVVNGVEAAERVVSVAVRDATLRIALVSPATTYSPRALVAARLAGIDLFVWHADGDPAWHVPFARTRAEELRAFIVVLVDGARAFAVDPDGIVVAGTFDGFRVAAFAYDSARSAATTVAPSTDVLEGLRTAERIRAV